MPHPKSLAHAQRGGLIAIGFWVDAVCGSNPTVIADAIVYAVDFLGAAHVALGSDFDGSVITPFDASELVVLP